MQNLYPEAKIILLGEFGVGKTSIFRRYSQGTFVDTSGMDWSQYRESTLGLDNYSRKFECQTANGSSKTISLRLYDTGGLERIGSISNSYYKFSDAVLLVFARNSLDSFICLSQHLLEVLSLAENAKVYLVSNKVDLNEIEVTDDDIRTFLEQFPNIEEYFQISCKNDQQSVDNMFCKIAQRIADWSSSRLVNRHFDSIKLTHSPTHRFNSGGDIFSNQDVNHANFNRISGGPSYEYQYERNADVYKPNTTCSNCMNM